jgi:glutathione peroxidase
MSVSGALQTLAASLVAIKGAGAVLSDPNVGAGGVALPVDPEVAANVDYTAFKLPYNHENIELKKFMGSNKATILFNMKIDDSQTQIQFPSLGEIYRKYKGAGLGVLAFPSEQGWFEPDDDETIREKSKVFYNFGDAPQCAVFDKIDFLGPSAHPLYNSLTKNFPTPNGYGRITLNYEKFLLDGSGKPVRRYPRKFSAYDMEDDIKAVLAGEALPEESEAFRKAWREAKREAVKSEYAFRYNLNYYTSPESMYKYDSAKDSKM